MKGDLYIGRGCRQRGLSCSQFANPYKVAKFGRSRAIELFSTFFARQRTASFSPLDFIRIATCMSLWSSAAVSCRRPHLCLFPFVSGCVRQNDPHSGVPPTSDQLNYLAELREEHGSSEGSTADEDAAPAGSGWKGSGKPMQVGIGYTVRDFCDGQSLASPGRWAPSDRRYPQSDAWSAVVVLVKRFSEVFGTTKLLMDLALGRIKKCPFPIEAVNSLKKEIVDSLSSRGLNLKREEGDRDELPIDFRFLGSSHRRQTVIPSRSRDFDPRRVDNYFVTPLGCGHHCDTPFFKTGSMPFWRAGAKNETTSHSVLSSFQYILRLFARDAHSSLHRALRTLAI